MSSPAHPPDGGVQAGAIPPGGKNPECLCAASCHAPPLVFTRKPADIYCIMSRFQNARYTTDLTDNTDNTDKGKDKKAGVRGVSEVCGLG
ncbi:hypothetical protein AGMMS49940_14800 [Spirochaetia bacterium]|nr:hypothetical protein AGMMS49940_14800 [Spirochaetia bacterium]